MESDFREELVRSNEVLRDPDSKLRKVLELEGHDTQNAYILHSIPEQNEDLYTVLIGGSYLVNVEIDKYDKTELPIVERNELRSYLHGLSKMNQVRLAVAQALACKKHNKHVVIIAANLQNSTNCSGSN